MSYSKYYSSMEDEIIKTCFPIKNIKEMIELLPNRTKCGIRVRASRLGVTKPKENWNIGKPINDTMFNNMSDFDKYYLAGIIDGEGCLRLSNSKNRYGNKTYHLMVQITNTDKIIMDWLKNKISGGRIYFRKSNNPKHNDCYQWLLTGNRNVIYFLSEMKKYLILKKEQADILSNGYTHLSGIDRELMYQKLKKLKNRRGI